MKVLVSYPAPCDRHAWGNAWAWHLIYQNIIKYLSTRRDPVCMNTKISLHGYRMEPAQVFVPIFVKVVVYPFHGEIVFAVIIIFLGICVEIILASMFKGGSRGWGTTLWRITSGYRFP